MKANRVAKKKDDRASQSLPRPSVSVDTPVASTSTESRPTKKPRSDVPPSTSTPRHPTETRTRAPGPVISSLFSFNPAVPAPTPSLPRPRSGPSNAPLNSSSFGALGLDPLLITHLKNKLGITAPTSIQRAALSATLLPSSSDVNGSANANERDVFIQSQTGSGKTLAYLLPIIQDLLPLSSLSYIDRSIGTLAIIIAPTRELAKQISDVLEVLLTLRLRPEDVNADGEVEEVGGSGEGEGEGGGQTARLTRWLVSGVLTGGATRTHEKARLRKGLPILVATPGRLLDHLQNTSSFNVGKCRWLVLDEADRLMELGFEDTITGILKGLDGRRNLARAANEGGGVGGDVGFVGGWEWERGRRTVLCSATMREDLEKLAGNNLNDPIVINGNELKATHTLTLCRTRPSLSPSPNPSWTPNPPPPP